MKTRLWYTHNGDARLAAELGLADTIESSSESPIGACSEDYVDMGTVDLRYPDEDEPYARVKVEVWAMPAQFYRFTIDILRGDGRGGVIDTGSGGLSTYWPTVKMIAEGMIDFTPAALPTESGR